VTQSGSFDISIATRIFTPKHLFCALRSFCQPYKYNIKIAKTKPLNDQYKCYKRYFTPFPNHDVQKLKNILKPRLEMKFFRLRFLLKDLILIFQQTLYMSSLASLDVHNIISSTPGMYVRYITLKNRIYEIEIGCNVCVIYYLAKAKRVDRWLV